MMNIAVLISGSGTNLQTLIDACERKEIEAKIVSVYSNKKNVYGLNRAEKHGIKTYHLEDLESLCDTNYDLIVLAGFLKILPKNVVEKYEHKIINIHPSLIPSFCGKGYYGMKVHQAVIDYGVKVTGCTTHFVSEGADEGPIIMQKWLQVEDDDAQSIQKKVLELEHTCLVESVKAFVEGRIEVKDRKVSIHE